MADGRTKPLAGIRVGDEIYGTVRRGLRRRYALTTVLAHWSTVKPAYRVVLADGTQLVASGDHRFLTEQGWRYVTGDESGTLRPYLSVSSQLVGTGGFAEAPKETTAYRRGYLRGVGCTVSGQHGPGSDGQQALARAAGYQAQLGGDCGWPAPAGAGLAQGLPGRHLRRRGQLQPRGRADLQRQSGDHTGRSPRWGPSASISSWSRRRCPAG